MKSKAQKQLIIYQAKNGAIKFRDDFDCDTIRGIKKYIADLFGIDRSVISRHISNIFKDKQLNKQEVRAYFAQTTPHGAIKGKTQTKHVEFYNLDILLAVGYRANSTKAIEFRKWAAKILKQHITKGYTINKKHSPLSFMVSLHWTNQLSKYLQKCNLGWTRILILFIE